MSENNRKPLIVALVCAVVAVAVLGFGIGFGGRSTSSGGAWQGTLSGIVASAPLTTADLRLTAGSCTISDRHVLVPVSCSFVIDEFGGSFDLGAVTKEARVTFISPAAGGLEIRMRVEGTDIAQAAQLGESTRLTVGRSGGSLTFECNGFGLGQCVLDFG